MEERGKTGWKGGMKGETGKQGNRQGATGGEIGGKAERRRVKEVRTRRGEGGGKEGFE